MQLHSFERRNSYIFFAILNQTHELFFAPPGIREIESVAESLTTEITLSIFKGKRRVNLTKIAIVE